MRIGIALYVRMIVFKGYEDWDCTISTYDAQNVYREMEVLKASSYSVGIC